MFAALNNYERATSDGFLLSNVVAARGRLRSCPRSPLTRSASGTGTPSQVSSCVHLGVPFATPARGGRFLQFGCFHSNPRGHDVPRFLGAGVGEENLVANAPRPDRFVRSTAGISRASRAARRWHLTVGIRWQRWQSAVSGLYYRRVTLPVQLWRSCGQPAAFRPALPWWQPFVFSYLSVTGWLRR